MSVEDFQTQLQMAQRRTHSLSFGLRMLGSYEVGAREAGWIPLSEVNETLRFLNECERR